MLTAVDLPADEAVRTHTTSASVATTGAGYPRFRAWMKDSESEYLADRQRRFATPSERTAAAGYPEGTLHRKMCGLR